MAPPIKQLQADPVVVKELQRRSRSATIAVRDRGRADIILLRLDGLGVEVVARRLNTTPKRVSLWSRRFETSGRVQACRQAWTRPQAVDPSPEGGARHHRGDASAEG